MQNRKQLLYVMLLGYGLPMLLIVGMVSALMLLETDVIYMDSLLYKALDIAVRIVDILPYAVSAAVIIYGIYSFGYSSLSTLYASYLFITVLHYVLLQCIEWFVFPGSLPQSIQELFTVFFENIVLFVIFDCLRIFLVGLATALLMKKQETKRETLNRTAKLLGNQHIEAREGIFPFASFVSFKNPIQLSIFITAAIYWLTFLVQYVYIDILALLSFDYVEGIWMQPVYLALNAVLACICYCVILFVLIGFDEKMPKKETTA